MKKIILFICVSVLLLGLVGCGKKDNTADAKDSKNQTTQDSKESNEEQNKEETVASGYAFEYNGVTMYVNTDAEPVVNALGEPLNYFEAESCAFKGLDKTYTYSGFEITTYPLNGKDYISSIYLTDDSVSTPEGIYIGSTVDDMIAAYGNDYTESSGSYTYIKDNSKLQFIASDNEIISITYLAIVDGLE